jgi:hypothetical protein
MVTIMAGTAVAGMAIMAMNGGVAGDLMLASTSAHVTRTMGTLSILMVHTGITRTDTDTTHIMATS